MTDTIDRFAPMFDSWEAGAHLYLGSPETTLCGYWRTTVASSSMHDHTEGFPDDAKRPCRECADTADALQNGGK